MRVTFDDGVEAAPGGERELIPDGVNNVRIHKASDDGDKLTIVLAPHGHYRLVYVDIKGDVKGIGKARALAAALGMNGDDWAGAEPGDLVGRDLRIETRQWVGNDAKTRVSVDKFLPAEVQPDGWNKPERPAARTPEQKVAAAKGEEAGGSDEIPF